MTQGSPSSFPSQQGVACLHPGASSLHVLEHIHAPTHLPTRPPTRPPVHPSTHPYQSCWSTGLTLRTSDLSQALNRLPSQLLCFRAQNPQMCLPPLLPSGLSPHTGCTVHRGGIRSRCCGGGRGGSQQRWYKLGLSPREARWESQAMSGPSSLCGRAG